MQVIGFNFTKIATERSPDFKQSSINTNIEFKDIQKESVELLKDAGAVKITFQYLVTYADPNEKKDANLGEILFNGNIVLAVTKNEEKMLVKSWKKKQVPPHIQIPLFNIILKKCTPKAVYLADEMALPQPVPFPTIKPKQ